MKTLVILNDGPYGTERAYNGLRLAAALSKQSDNEARVFLLGDAVACAKVGQNVPEGFYNIQLMLGRVLRNNGQVGVCGTCMDARGITNMELSAGTERAQWTSLRTGPSGRTKCSSSRSRLHGAERAGPLRFSARESRDFASAQGRLAGCVPTVHASRRARWLRSRMTA
jgi:uncharacterized protein involved in oxidation of intracellular sulfur